MSVNWLFLILGAITLAAAGAAITLRNLIHCAFCLALSLVGLAALFIQLGAEFVGLAQMLVYVGAVAILIVFAILLTRSSESGAGRGVVGRAWPLGLLVALAALMCLAAAILRSPSLRRMAAAVPPVTAQDLGAELMSRYVLPLEVMGLLLTAALMGAVIIAMREKGEH